MIVSFGLVGSSSATSPQPEEVKPGQTATICTTHIVYITDREKGTLQHEASSTLAYEASMPKAGVLEKITAYISNKLDEWNVSEFRLECKFPK